MLTADFDYELPPELIAQTPAPVRDQSRLLVVHRASGQLEHRSFPDLLSYLKAGDIMVLNNSRVIPARLLEENATNDWWAMVRPGKRAREGTQIVFRDAQGGPSNVSATVIGHNADGHRRLQFSGTPNVADMLPVLGELPLPPYIARNDGSHTLEDRQRYQTIFAEPPGSVAAPTAGLHFTESMFQKIRDGGIEMCFVTLHVGAGTFAPVKADQIADHIMHEERFDVSEDTAAKINAAKRQNRRIIAAGTTSVRVLESLAQRSADNTIAPGTGRTRIFLYPPSDFKIVDGLLTNFHLPKSTLMMLVSAFAAPRETRGRDMVLAAYAEAVRQRYRFFSYGDAMLLL